MGKVILSIILTTYKRSNTLKRAIDSVLQSNSNYQLIIVDDNDPMSYDRSEDEKIIDSYDESDRIMYIKHERNLNGATARNTGISVAEGSYITFLDNDDEFCNDRIEKVISVIEKDNPDFIYTGYETRVNNNIYEIVTTQPNKTRNDLIVEMLKQKTSFGTGSNMICRKTIVEKIGGFDTSFLRHQDFEFLIRYLEECNSIIYIPEVLVIKHDDDFMNLPNFEKLLDVKEKYLNKFSYIIDSFDDDDKKELYRAHYYPLLDIALYNNDDIQIDIALRKIIELEIYDKKRILELRLKNTFKRRKKVWSMAKSIKGKFKNAFNTMCLKNKLKSFHSRVM